MGHRPFFDGLIHVIFNITGDISLIEANEAATYVQELAGDGANIIFGARYEKEPADTCTITVIATGISDGATTTKLTTAKGQESKYSSNIAKTTASSFAAKPAVKEEEKDDEPVIEEVEIKPEVQREPQLSFTTPSRNTNTGRDITIPDFLKKR